MVNPASGKSTRFFQVRIVEIRQISATDREIVKVHHFGGHPQKYRKGPRLSIRQAQHPIMVRQIVDPFLDLKKLMNGRRAVGKVLRQRRLVDQQ